MPKLSLTIFARGARQLVVQLALETIVSAVVYFSSLTPRTKVGMSGSLAGAEMITRLAPAFRCEPAVSRLVNRPVDSMT